MKIMQIIPSLCIAGAERMCEQLSCELKILGHEVVVVSLYTMKTPLTENLEKQGIRIIFLEKKGGFDPSIVTKLNTLIKKEDPDVVHAHLNALIYAVFATKKHIIYTVHNVASKDSPKIVRCLTRRYFRNGRVIPVALSEIIQDTIEKEYRLDRSGVSVVLNGIDLNKCIPKKNYTVGDKIVLIHVGRFSAQKNHIGMLKAFEVVHNKYPNTVLRLVGDGEKRQEIVDFINTHKLSDCVELLGVQSNVYPFLEKADIFLLPSLYEGISISLAEAMGTGLPIVATATGGTPDMIVDGESGFLCSLDTQDIADCIEQYLNDDKLRERHGRAALAAAERFSSVTMAQKYLSVYESSISSKIN